MDNTPRYTNVPVYNYNPVQDFTGEQSAIYLGGAYQGTPGPAYYQPPGVPAPPQPAYPQNYAIKYYNPTVNIKDCAQGQASVKEGNIVPGSIETASTPQPSVSQVSRTRTNAAKEAKKDINATGSREGIAKPSKTTGHDEANAGQPKQKDKEIDVADGNLTLQLPAAGTTEEKPPDGGLTAWKVVLACSILNACSTTCVLILSFSKSSMTADLGEDPTESIITACSQIRLLAAPLVAIAIVKFDYRKVSATGSIMVMIGFFVSGFLPSNVSGLVGVFVGAVAGLGLGCWYICAIIPILEYFQRRRMLALILSNLGSLVIIIIILVVYIESLKTEDQMDWKLTFKCMLVPGAVGLFVSYFIPPLQLHMKDNTGRNFVEKTLGVLDLKLFKELALYLVMLLYFFDQFGRSLPQTYVPAMMKDKNFSPLQTIQQLLLLPAGMLSGYIFLYYWKHRQLLAVLLLWGPMDLLVGYLTLQIPAYDKFGWVAVYTVVFGITEEYANSRHEEDDYAAAFYVAASMLIVAGVCALLSRFLLLRRKAKESPPDVDGNENSNEEQNKMNNSENKGQIANERQDEGDDSNIEDVINAADEIVNEIDITDMEY
ncbi:monocarboxylate transporter 4-like isoform X2 [Argopecten irradians]|uniref:monocarboxylate transporter 4-like isoform X2 n=1 Tax=Argopecten irradians TaxID=31199 RepID=UPI003710BA74